MNTNIDLSLSLAADGSALPSLFFRPADRLRLEACVAALTEESRSVALSSQHDAALDHYGKLLAERLRRACPQGQIETYFPASTEALVGQFNEVLACRTLREAMTEGGALAPQRIWVIHDAGALAEHELQLLARLVSHFPGANIRVVLLLGPARRSRKAFESLGRRFVRWDIEAPTAEQARTMLEQARIEGCESLVAQLLRHLQPEVVGPISMEGTMPATEPFSFLAHDRHETLAGLAARGGQASWLERLKAWPAAQRTRLRLGARSAMAAGMARLSSLSARVSWRPEKAPDAGQSAARGGSVRAGRIAGWPWILAITGLVGLSIAFSAWLHGAGFGQAKPALGQPVKADRSLSTAPGIKPAASRAEGAPTVVRSSS